MVVVVVSLTTVPSGCVVVVVLVVDVVELVVTGEGGTATCGAGLAEEQPAANPQRTVITKAEPASLRTEIMILGCLRRRWRVKHFCRRGSLAARSRCHGPRDRSGGPRRDPPTTYAAAREIGEHLPDRGQTTDGS